MPLKVLLFALFLPYLVSAGANVVPSEVDVLVVGGTTKGVEAAVAARESGKSVYLVTPYAYLGEDLAGTLELGFGGAKGPVTPLEKRLWSSRGGLAAYDYFPDRPTDGLRWIYKNDEWARLSEPNPPPTSADVVLYLGDVTYRCVLRKPAKVSKVAVLTMEADTYSIRDIVSRDNQAKLAKTKPGNRRAATQAVELRFLSEPRKGETVVFANRGPQGTLPGCFVYPTGRKVLFEAEVGDELSEVEITLRQDPSAHHQLVSRIWFHLAEQAESVAPPTPLQVKRTCDRELTERGIGFMTSCPVRRVVPGKPGEKAYVEVVNRSGRHALRAGEVVDATPYGMLGRVPSVGPAETFSRIVIADRSAPSAPGMKVEKLTDGFADAHSAFRGTMYRCTFSLPMKDGTYPSFAAAEWAARELTQTERAADEADLLVWHPSADMKSTPLSDELPVWGEYDVVVIGGGTAGAPAGIAAARSGAKTLIVEYRDVLGGTGTDGMVNGYFDGNDCGFTTEFKNACSRSHGHGGYCRAAVWNDLCRKAGVTVWLGALGLEVVREGSRVTGVEVATPLGCGIVKAKCVIDGTGNADIAAAAGARTEFVSSREIAVQSAGQAPQRLGFGTINSDFGYLNDADASDLWLFGLRARAGAPDAWDLAKLPGSRERRRIVPDYRLRGEDVVAGRRYPDVIAQARSRQDPHGYLTDDFGYLAEETTELERAAHENRAMFNVNLPLRCMLPRGVDGVAVVGLGAGIERDVVSITRMQADLMNMGYGVGVAAAMAVRCDGDFRRIDCRELRKRLVEKGILRKDTLDWNEEDDVSSDALIAASVRSLPDGYRGGHAVYRPENRSRALPLLRTAYVGATNAAARQTYALALGLLGDATGVETLVRCLDGAEGIVDVRSDANAPRGGKFSRAYTAGKVRHGMMLALGRTKHDLGCRTLGRIVAGLDGNSSLDEVRHAMLAATAFARPELADDLARLLDRPGVSGHAVGKAEDLPPLGGYGGGPEFELCFRELAIAHALLTCGDRVGKARKVYEAYAKDPRGILAAHAQAVLDEANGAALPQGCRPKPRQAQLDRMRDGIDVYGIVHWGLNTYTDREWGYGDENPAWLDPAKFDADQIVRACAAGGLKGLIIVAKHHDGFCLWPTKTTGHNITKSPFRGGKGDYVREMADACRRAGMKFGVYVSPWDRNNADYATEKYVETYHAQIKELLSGDYGPVFEMWFDGANGGDGYYGGARERRKISAGYYRFPEVYAFVRELQPGVCIFAGESDASDFRWPGNEKGILEPDSRATIETVGGFVAGKYGNPRYKGMINRGAVDGSFFRICEADFPLRKGWFYHEKERGTTKSAAYLMQRYLGTVGNGGTMNLGIAPNREGRLDEEDVRALKGFGELQRMFFAREVADGEPFNLVVMQEDVTEGELVDSWRLEGDGKLLAKGTSVGIRRIRTFDEPVRVRDLELKATSETVRKPTVAVRRYFVDPELLKTVMTATTSSGETDTAKWMQKGAGAE